MTDKTVLAKSVFLANLHYFYAQTDGTYKFPNSAEGDLLKTAKREVEELRAVLASAGEQAKDAKRGRWIIDNSSVGGGIANMQATPRPAKFIRFPAIEGDTVESAIDAAIAGKSEVQG